MRFLIVFIWLLILGHSNAETQGNCELEGVSQSQWKGSYTNQKVNDYERLLFKVFKTKNVIGVKVQGIDYGKYFEAKLKREELIVYPTHQFQLYELQEASTKTPEMNINLIFQCQNNFSQKLAFYQPINDINTYRPQFSKKEYKYKVPMPLQPNLNLTNFGELITASDFDISNVRLSFAMKSSKDFDMIWDGAISKNNKNHSAVLRSTRWVQFTANKKYDILVTDMGSPNKTDVAVLRLEIDRDASLKATPEFQSPYYEGLYLQEKINHEIIIYNKICLKEADLNTQIEVLDLSEHFSIQMQEKCIKINLIKNLDNETLNTSNPMILTLQATVQNADKPGKTILILHPSIKLSEHPTASINFEKDNYWFDINSYFKGVLGFVTAFAYPTQAIKYYLESLNDDPVPQEFYIFANLGLLKLCNTLKSGTYTIGVKALATKSHIWSKTVIVIHVTDLEINFKTKYALLTIHIREDEESLTELPCEEFQKCQYEILEQFPSTEPMLFFTHMNYLYNIALDREMDEIIQMKVPQFTLRLKLSKINYESRSQVSHKNISKRSTSFVQEWLNLPHKIPNEINQIIISVIVDDINDNPPIFQENDNLIIGYPNPELAEQLLPSLTQVHATDADEGINAELEFSTESTLVIHPKTGIIYPTEKLDNDFDFVVTATDLNGHPNGLFTDLKIEIKILQKSNLLVLKLPNVMPDEMQEKLEEISILINSTVKYLISSLIPSQNQSEFARKCSNSTRVSRAIIYGISSVGSVLNSEELESLLRSSNSTNLEIEKWEDSVFYKCNPSKCEATGFIASMAILGSILFIIIIIISSYYYLKMFKYNRTAKKGYAASIEDTSSTAIDNNSRKESLVSDCVLNWN